MVNYIKSIKNNMRVMNNYPLTIISIYFVTFFVYRDFGVRMLYGYSILSLILLLFFVYYFRDNSKIKILNTKIPYIVLSIITLMIFLRPGSLKDKQNIVYIIIMLITTGFLITTKENKDDILKSMKIFIIAASVFSLIIIFFQIFRQPFWNFVFPILSPTAQVYAKKYFFSGYSMSLGGISYTLYVIIFGLLSSIAKLLFFKPVKKEKIIYITLIVMFSFVIVLSGRRGELLALIIALGLFFILSGNVQTRKIRIRWVILTIVVVMIAVILLLPVLSQVKFLRRYTMTLNALLHGIEVNGGVSSGRDQLYRKAWELFLKHPVFGIGHGRFTIISSSIHLSVEGKGMDVHNSVLQLLAETGIVGLIMVLTPVIYIYWNTIKDTMKLWNDGRSSVDSVIISSNTISLIMQTFIIVTSLVDPINYKIVFWLIYYISFYLYVLSHNTINPETREYKNKVLYVYKG